MNRFIVAGLLLLLGGCAAQMMQGAQNECTAFGYPQGSPAYAQCVQQQYAAKQANFQSSMARLGQVGQQMSAQPAGGGATAFLRSQTVSGTSRICSYDRMGSPYVITIGAVDICPISIP